MFIAVLIDKLDANGYVVASASTTIADRDDAVEALRIKVVEGKMSFSTYDGRVTLDNSTFHDAMEGISEDWVVETFDL